MFILLMMASFASMASADEWAYGGEDELRYLNDFSELMEMSYSEPLPANLIASCKNAGPIATPESVPIVETSGSMSAAEVQNLCGTNSICTIPNGAQLTMDGNLNVAALIVKGTLRWTNSSQDSNSKQWLCAGYVVVEDSGLVEVSVKSSSNQAFIYIKNNGMEHPRLGVRAFGADGSARLLPRVYVQGREFTRTWSLLARSVQASSQNIQLLHDPSQMNSRVGDRIGLAATKESNKGESQAFTIVALHADNVIELSEQTLDSFRGQGVFTYDADAPAHLAAEVVNLSRSVVITGDDFENVTGGVCTKRKFTIFCV